LPVLRRPPPLPASTPRHGREGLMAHRPPTPAAPPDAAVTAARPAPGFTGYTTPAFRATPLGRLLYPPFRICASLQLAIVLLSLFALCLALATFLESAYGARVAQELVYRTWWFTGLLGLLAVNILCAALKKFPWKRHQTGFLITHAGLLV